MYCYKERMIYDLAGADFELRYHPHEDDRAKIVAHRPDVLVDITDWMCSDTAVHLFSKLFDDYLSKNKSFVYLDEDFIDK